MQAIGEDVFTDYNHFKQRINQSLKEQKIKLNISDKNAILNSMSCYDENAEKVIKKTTLFKQDKLDELLLHLGCKQSELANFGYFPTSKSNQYTVYESNATLRDSESIPLKDNIQPYFLKEVKPHIDEAWINLDSTKIGYEISFNKYFYQHKPLRSIEEVAKEILALEAQSEGLIADILGVA